MQINTWIIAPYKAPKRNDPDNEVFNNHVSILRIRSEHAIGFLKGRFQSLKNLWLHIKDQISHIIGTYWVAACIGIHAFAIRHEAEEKHRTDQDFNEFADNYRDPFHQGKPQLHISPNNWNIWWNYFEFLWIKSNYCSEQITSNYPILIWFLTLTWGYFRVTLKLLISVYKLLASDTKLHCG